MALQWPLKGHIWSGSQLRFWLCLLPLPIINYSVSVTIALFLFLEYNVNTSNFRVFAFANPSPWNAFNMDIYMMILHLCLFKYHLIWEAISNYPVWNISFSMLFNPVWFFCFLLCTIYFLSWFISVYLFYCLSSHH